MTPEHKRELERLVTNLEALRFDVEIALAEDDVEALDNIAAELHDESKTVREIYDDEKELEEVEREHTSS